MRKVIENQLKIGQVDIPNIQIDINCRDEIPQLLLGLQEIYKDKEVREKVFKILEKIVPTNDEERLKGRCDSFVLETDVHYPTDINLLWDAIRKIIILIASVTSFTS